jgi:hypothetical protein
MAHPSRGFPQGATHAKRNGRIVSAADGKGCGDRRRNLTRNNLAMLQPFAALLDISVHGSERDGAPSSESMSHSQPSKTQAPVPYSSASNRPLMNSWQHS